MLRYIATCTIKSVLHSCYHIHVHSVKFFRVSMGDLQHYFSLMYTVKPHYSLYSRVYFVSFNILPTLNKCNHMYLYIYTSHRDTGTQYSVHTSLAVRHGFKLLRLRQTALVQSLSQQICPLSQAKAGLRQDPPPTWSTQGTSLVEGQLVVSERWTYGMETGDWHV